MTYQPTRVWININTGEWGYGDSPVVTVEFPSMRELDLFTHLIPDQHARFVQAVRDAINKYRVEGTTNFNFQIPAADGTVEMVDTVEMVVFDPVHRFSIWAMTDSQGCLVTRHLVGGRDPRTQAEFTLCGLNLPTGAQPAPPHAPTCERCKST